MTEKKCLQAMKWVQYGERGRLREFESVSEKEREKEMERKREYEG